jgi:hypothetical protein
MPSKKIPRLRFGGWYSYQEWAEHGFVPKAVHQVNEPAPDTEPAVGTVRDTKTLPDANARDADDAPDVPGGAVPPTPPDRPKDRPHRPTGTRGAAPPDLYPAPPDTGRPRQPVIRPYVLTGGRTRPQRELAVHALVLTTESGRGALNGLLAEYQAICRLCETVRPVAEVAAQLAIPLGVARVLIDDLARQSLITINEPAPDSGQSLEILTRVLDGLRRL